ncbi:MAG: CHAT domain-containing protein [Acidimicrobiia bacterium]|nr:CHAT domain-containing protein [Acidimicrobiia bacterium]MDX2467954.1 CHAT domain-containing protein [Acidimicrobiia bacterium]
MTQSLREEANQALEIAREDPNTALQHAVIVLDSADDEEAIATAHFACGLAYRTLSDVPESTRHLESAEHHARPWKELHGRVLRSLAFNYAQSGQNRRADRTIEQSISLLTGQEQDLSRVQQAFMLLMRGDLQEALPILDQAIDAFAASSDDDYLELTLANRALIHMESGDADLALRDLRRAYKIAVRLEHQVSAADIALHTSQVLGWLDDIPGAMKWHARSMSVRAASGIESPVAEAEHAYVLIQARLMREAEELLVSWVPRLVSAGDHAVVTQAHLQLAEVLLARGAHDEAAAQVALAEQITPSDGRYRFDVAAASHNVQIAGLEFTPALLESMMATAFEMAANGERHAAALERFRAVDVALALDDLVAAVDLCEDAPRIVRSGPLWLQIQAWTALAKVRLASDNPRGASAAVRAGIRRLDEYRGGIGAADLRVHATDLGARLAGIGVELALASGSARRVFEWSEQLRTTSLAVRPAATPDPDFDAALTQLRQVTARLRGASNDQLAGLRREQAQHERKVRQLARQMRASRQSFSAGRLSDVQDQLGHRLLVEFVESADRIGAVVVSDRSVRLVDLGTSPHPEAILDHLRFAAERIARPSTSPSSRAAALQSVAELVTEIRSNLIDPLHLDAERIVVIPSTLLHGVPWGLVLAAPVEVAPSATVWLLSRTDRKPADATVVIKGPGLVHASAEVDEISAVSGGTVTTTVAETLTQLQGAKLAHFACHARPRLDSPMFSSLVLEEGELTLYDIERLDQPPDTVVLAACDGGSAVMASGDEILGLANAFLSIGTRTVVAPLFTVSDAATATVMKSLHHSLAAGIDPATALHQARQTNDPLLAFTAGSFACFGS